MDILIVIGSKSDLDIGNGVIKIFKKFDVEYAIHVASAHRTPDKVKSLIEEAEEKGAKVIIAGAGMSAHLAGVIASHTLLPVIGIPIVSGPLDGVDALLSTVNMPGGVPVATVSIGLAGAKNAALLACRIMALNDAGLKEKLDDYRQEMAKAVEEADSELER